MVCLVCLGSGLKPGVAETVDGAQQMAWEPCPQCRASDARKLEIYEEAEEAIRELACRLDLVEMDRLAGVFAAALLVIRDDVEALREGDKKRESVAERWFRALREQRERWADELDHGPND